jgi:predicted PurR-regulated permease PerM
MTTRTTEEIRGDILYAIMMTALVAVLLWCAYNASHALLIVYVSALFALGFSPIVRVIEHQRVGGIAKRMPRWLAILILYLAILGTVALVLFLIFPPLVQQGQALWDKKEEFFDKGQQFLISKGWMKEHVTISQAVEAAPGTKTDAVTKVLGAIGNVAGGIFGIFTILILTFYMLIDSWSLRAQALYLFPKKHRARIEAASREAMMKVSAWLGGQLLLAAVIGVTSAIGLWALGVPFFYVLALVSAVGEMIPVVGPILSAIPAIAVAATVSGKTVLFVVIFFVLQQQLENHVLVPKIMSRQVGVSAVTVIVALLIGGSLLGIVGALLAVPTAAILQVVVAEFISHEPKQPRKEESAKEEHKK